MPHSSDHPETSPPRRPRPVRGLRALRTVPNLLSVVRLCAVPVLWAVALLGHPVAVGVGWAAAGATDLVDGFVARRAGQATALGSRLDSLADHLLSASGLGWLLLFRPGFFHEQWALLVTWMALALVVLGVSWVKFRRVVDLHLYSAKVAGFAATLFGISLLVLGSYRPAVFHLVFAACVLATIEALLLLLTRDRVDEHLGSILKPRRRG